MSKRILITGSEGLVGRAIRRNLIAQGYDVVGLDLRATSNERGDVRTHKVKKPFTFDLMDTDSGLLVSFSLRENKAKKTPRPTFKFTACSYEQFERLCPDSESYDETEIDGKIVIAAYDGKNCIGMWYRRAKVGSFCREFVGDELSYSEADPNWPYGN